MFTEPSPLIPTVDDVALSKVGSVEFSFPRCFFLYLFRRLCHPNSLDVTGSVLVANSLRRIQVPVLSVRAVRAVVVPDLPSVRNVEEDTHLCSVWEFSAFAIIAGSTNILHGCVPWLDLSLPLPHRRAILAGHLVVDLFPFSSRGWENLSTGCSSSLVLHVLDSLPNLISQDLSRHK
ncbi:hypothetical protein F511_09025 [Dorcoceras hygrometricum]|uniref:Uncharacterized protein n=1 Tax=Dorcoceras hygrometricum TaxID=472368 RepID=A0A2Z7CEK8_9LAMI|nr:hypothetical protein F511_09025 [Dorcoceras hygrometricum]